jgi:hypothetical protein
MAIAASVLVSIAHVVPSAAAGSGPPSVVGDLAPACIPRDEWSTEEIIFDRFADVVAVGAPTEDIGSVTNAGRVTLIRPVGERPMSFVALNQESLGAVSEAGDRFGTVVTLALLNDDECTDLLISAPGEDAGAGVVFAVLGWTSHSYDDEQLPGGIDVTVLRQGDGVVAGTAEAGDRFGSAIAVGDTGLWVGAPGEDVGNAADAGVVTSLSNASVEYSQASPGVPGLPETGDAFGSTLASRFSVDGGDLVFIGVPGEDIGGKVDAGMVVAGRAGAFTAITQNSRGVPGFVEAGDRFGQSMTTLRTCCDADSDAMLGLLVGAAGEDAGSVVDAGAVVLFHDFDTWVATGSGRVDWLTQDSPGVPGVVERNDRFGSVLHNAGTFVFIGTPYEDVGAVRDAGAFSWLVPFGESWGPLITQNTTHIPGTAEAGDHFGASYASRPHGRWDWYSYVGAPGESVGGASGAGSVTQFSEDSGGPWTHALNCCRLYTQSTAGVPGSSETGDGFGANLSSSAW